MILDLKLKNEPLKTIKIDVIYYQPTLNCLSFLEENSYEPKLFKIKDIEYISVKEH